MVYIDEIFYFFFQDQYEILVEKPANFFAREEDRMTSVGSNFLSPPVRRRPPKPNPLPIPVDVINGWPLNQRRLAN